MVQVYGYHSAIRARSTTGGAATSTPVVAAGVPLTMKSTVFCLETFAICVEATSTASAYASWKVCALSLGATSGFTTSAIAGIVMAM